jgi:hypothetical protein
MRTAVSKLQRKDDGVSFDIEFGMVSLWRNSWC